MDAQHVMTVSIEYYHEHDVRGVPVHLQPRHVLGQALQVHQPARGAHLSVSQCVFRWQLSVSHSV